MSHPFCVMRKVYLGQARFLEGKHSPQKCKLEKFEEKRKLKGFFLQPFCVQPCRIFLSSFNKDIHLFLMINVGYLYELLYMPKPKGTYFLTINYPF